MNEFLTNTFQFWAINEISLYRNFLMIIIGILFYLRNRSNALRIYSNYYREKRSKFTWLENWIKEHKTDPAKVRATENTVYTIILAAALFVGISIIGGIVLDFIIQKGTEIFLAASNLVANELEYMLYMSIGSVLAILIAMIISQRVWKSRFKDVRDGGALECPTCECPHSWVMLYKLNVIDNIILEKTTTTTTKTQSADSFGGGFIGGLAANASSESSTVKSTFTIFEGRVISDYKCNNCGHTQRDEYNSKWFGKKNRPDETEHFFDPPKEPWEPASEGYSKILHIILLVAMLGYAGYCVKSIIDDRNAIITDATLQHFEEPDSSINATVSSRYLKVSVRSEIDRQSQKIAEIQAGEFFTIIEVLGKNTLVNYRNHQGYVASQAVKPLQNHPIGRVLRDVQVNFVRPPDPDITTMRIPKGRRVTLLGQVNDDNVMVEYRKMRFWISARDLQW
ncbi:MAG: thioesterase family protein [Treponema sp.]|nr:thioesterase family protein [Treponema sp.]